MIVGTLGNIVFEVSEKAAQIITELNWDSKAKYSTHNLHMKKGQIELTGFDPDEASFTVTLSAFLGVNPHDMLTSLEIAKNSGAVNTLVIGTKVIGTKWVVKEIKRKFNQMYQDGELISCDVTVSLLEYV